MVVQVQEGLHGRVSERAVESPTRVPHSKHNMRFNAHTAIVGTTVVLVPYRHVICSGIFIVR